VLVVEPVGVPANHLGKLLDDRAFLLMANTIAVRTVARTSSS
jgi:hypothetical protein